MKLKPLGDRVLVQPVEEEEMTASGIASIGLSGRIAWA